MCSRRRRVPGRSAAGRLEARPCRSTTRGLVRMECHQRSQARLWGVIRGKLPRSGLRGPLAPLLRVARQAAKWAGGPCWSSWRPWCSRLRELHLSNGDDLIQRLACESKYVFRNLPPGVRLCLPDTPVERLGLVPENIARLPSGAGELHSEGICFV